MTKRTYKAHPEFIGRNVELDNGHNTNELYDLEAKAHNAIRAVVEWRRDNLKEEEWGNALPQTLRTMLEGWDSYASKVAAESYLSGQDAELKQE